jgi:hypothetical protein
MQRRAAGERGVETSPGVTVVPSSPNVIPRSRERETR